MFSVITTKWCPLCRTRRSLEYFWTRENPPYQSYTWCILCCSDEHREYDYPLISVRGGGSLGAGECQLREMVLVS
jgi:hypothetical protein